MIRWDQRAPEGRLPARFDQLLLMHVNDTLTFRMRGEGCRLESYNVTIANLSTGEKFSFEARGRWQRASRRLRR